MRGRWWRRGWRITIWAYEHRLSCRVREMEALTVGVLGTLTRTDNLYAAMEWQELPLRSTTRDAALEKPLKPVLTLTFSLGTPGRLACSSKLSAFSATSTGMLLYEEGHARSLRQWRASACGKPQQRRKVGARAGRLHSRQMVLEHGRQAREAVCMEGRQPARPVTVVGEVRRGPWSGGGGGRRRRQRSVRGARGQQSDHHRENPPHGVCTLTVRSREKCVRGGAKQVWRAAWAASVSDHYTLRTCD